jgi:CRISPR-associated protein Cmr1
LKLTRRLAVPQNKTFHLKISFHPRATDDDIKKFFSALWLAFNLGNFGSRARRGFGAIKIEEIKENGSSMTNNCYGLNFVPSDDLENWINYNLNKIKDFIKPNDRQDIPYLFKNFEIYRIQKNNFNYWKDWIKEVQKERKGRYLKNSWSGNSINNWFDLLDFMGFLLMAYRSYRKPDYNVAKSILHGGQVSNATFERAIFGLPLNFYFSSINKGDMVHLKLGNETLRRASPLMIKIIQTGTKQDEISYEGLFIIMKSTFMPANARLVFSNKEVNLPNNIWQALDDFLSTLQNNNLIRRIYP